MYKKGSGRLFQTRWNVSSYIMWQRAEASHVVKWKTRWMEECMERRGTVPSVWGYMTLIGMFSHQLARTASMSLTKFWAKQMPKICRWRSSNIRHFEWYRENDHFFKNIMKVKGMDWPAVAQLLWIFRPLKWGCPAATSQTAAHSLLHWCSPSALSPVKTTTCS